MKKRSGDPRDVEIGKRMRALRLERGLSQTELGTLLDVTFQQVQKYEKGANRVAAGRLQRVAEALEVPITFFYGGPGADAGADVDTVDVGLGFLVTPGAVRLVRAYSRITDPILRRALVELTERAAQSPQPASGAIAALPLGSGARTGDGDRDAPVWGDSARTVLVPSE